MDVSVIIVNYNTRQMTSECIDSIFDKTDGVTFEIILVDNASSDGSKEHFEQDRRITYIYNEENLGFGRANNVGYSKAQGRNILFLNPDTLLINNAIQILSTYLDSRSEVGVCGGNLYDEEMQPALSFRRVFPGIKEECFNLLFHIPERVIWRKAFFFNHTMECVNVTNVSGADLMIKSTVFAEIGGFLPDYFMYYEETDLCFRVAKYGYRLVSVPQAEIQHLEGKSFKVADRETKRLKVSEEGRHCFYRLNYSRTTHRIANFIYQLALIFHCIVYCCCNKPYRVRNCQNRLSAIKALNKTI